MFSPCKPRPCRAFATSTPPISRCAPTSSRTWRTVATPVRVRGVRRPAARAARALHGQERRRDRGAALQLHRQGRPRGRAAAGDDAHPRAHGGGARQRAQEADPLVLHPAALPLRAAAAGAASRALPAQLRPDRRAGAARRRRDHRPGGGRHARVRARAGRRAGAAVRPAGAARPAARRRRGGAAARRGVSGGRQDRADRPRGADASSSRAAGVDRPTRSTRVFEIAALRGLPSGRVGAGRRARRRRSAAQPLRRVVDALDAMGLGEFVEVDLTIVRGLAYYTGTVFELFDAGRSSAPSAAAAATTTCSRRWAASTCRRWLRHGRRGARRAASRTAGWSRPTTSSIDVFLAAVDRGRPAVRARAWRTSCATRASAPSTRSRRRRWASSSSWPTRGTRASPS